MGDINKKISFKQALQDAGLSVKQFSELSDTPLRTVYSWVNGERRAPGIAWEFLKLWQRTKNKYK